MTAAPKDPPDLWMPDAEAEALRAAYRGARRIVEYGAGGSTLFAARHTDADLVSIESDETWARDIRDWMDRLGCARDGIDLRWVDVGPVGKWGMPTGPAAFRKFPNYALAPWAGDAPMPDLVFIDGRFRLGCFAATLLHATAPVTVLWDDYGDRTAYHAAEALARPAAMIGRMARFDVTPRTLAPAEIARMVPWFSLPG
ncbi:hypothetical protein [Paracoccus luteus]|uniref:hypothetical protein n=1 Tax=Paracoccus luteus TaxID=2508543 RepID=UPI0010704870|nr:hypothetical protein [Paracoccus luteus]